CRRARRLSSAPGTPGLRCTPEAASCGCARIRLRDLSARAMKSVLIFDLDNCLAPATAVGPELYAPAFAAIRAAGAGVLSPAALDAAEADYWRDPLDRVADHYGFPEALRRVAFDAFRPLEVEGRLQGYADIDVVRRLPGHRFLVTTGFRCLQTSKIRALGI